MQFTFLRSRIFWIGFVVTIVLLGSFFLWELGYLVPLIPSLPRPAPTQSELLFTCLLIFLFALDVGLFYWRSKYGSCPRGTRRASTVAGALGAFTLLCPACLIIPFSLFGISLSLFAFAPYLPLLRTISIILLIASTLMLWPKKQ